MQDKLGFCLWVLVVWCGLRFRRIYRSTFRVVEEKVKAQNWLGVDEFFIAI